MNVPQTSYLDFGFGGPLEFIIKKWGCQSEPHPVEGGKDTQRVKNAAIYACRQVCREQDTEQMGESEKLRQKPAALRQKA